MSIAEKRDVPSLEAPRHAAAQQYRKDAALVQPPLEPLKNVPGAENAITKGTKGHGCLLESNTHVVMVPAWG